MNFIPSIVRFSARICCMLLLFSSLASHAHDAPHFNLSNVNKTTTLGSLHWADVTKSVTPAEAKVQLLNTTDVDDHFTVPLTDASHWFALTIHNPTERAQTPTLYVRSAYPNKVNLHYQQNTNWVSQFNGTDVPLAQRQVRLITPAFQLDLEPNESRTYYLEVHTKIKLLAVEINIDDV